MSHLDFFIDPLASTKSAALGAASAIGGGLYAAIATPAQNAADNLPVVAGIAVGIVGIGWSIYSGGIDRRAKALTDQITLLQQFIKDRDEDLARKDRELDACQAQRAHYRERCEVLAARVARIQEEHSHSDKPLPPN
jgi:hypothetical protein